MLKSLPQFTGIVAASLLVIAMPSFAATTDESPAWLSQPLSLADALNVALRQNTTILQSQSDIEASYGIVVQTRAITLPRVQATGNYQLSDKNSIESVPFPGSPGPNDQRWALNLQVVQSIYEGGRMKSALRVAELTKEQALLQHQTVVADTLVAVRVAYDDVLLTAQQITVQEASVKLLQKELEDNTRRFDAGTVPRFNVLRAEVEVANARPRLIRARNGHRIAKDNLANLLGYQVPKGVGDVPLRLSGTLSAEPYDLELSVALGKALENRTELMSLRKAEGLRREDIVNAQAGRKPSAQVYTGYGSHSSSLVRDLTRDVSGWNVGAQVSWNIFDGKLTQGRVDQAQAQLRKTQTQLDDVSRRIELEVRTAYSNFIEAREVLESQKKVQEQAEEALRLANARSDAGTGTQLDVLSAQTSLTEARTTQVQALRDYSVARSRLERAIGLNIQQTAGR